MNEETREPLSAAEIEEARIHVSRHIGITPEWITRLLAGSPVEVNRSQLAYFAAWKARYGVTEVEKTPIGATQPPAPATTAGFSALPSPSAPLVVRNGLVSDSQKQDDPTNEGSNEPKEADDDEPWF